ncbi:MAG: hypothetical protein PHP98_00455 [Kiritimatiellae bacterium]|nr:hypothetical protein [Kiritimatiellia bacterium]
MKEETVDARLHPAIHRALNNIAPDLRRLATNIHSFPELGFKENRACRQQAGLLRKWRFKVETPFAGIATAYKAAAGKDKPALCFMAEYETPGASNCPRTAGFTALSRKAARHRTSFRTKPPVSFTSGPATTLSWTKWLPVSNA